MVLNTSRGNQGTGGSEACGYEGIHEIEKEEMQQLTILEKPLEELSYHELVKFITKARNIKQEKYSLPSTKHKVSPRLRKCFSSKASLIYFFRTMSHRDSMGRRIHRKNSKKLLLRQFFYALRGGEVNNATYDPRTKLVRIQTLKMGRVQIDYLPFIEGTQSLFDCEPVSKDCLRNTFRRHLDRLGREYSEVYHKDLRGHDLRRLSAHSLRATAANLFRQRTKDKYKTKVFLRHSIEREYGATAAYLEYDEEEFRKDLNRCFRSLVRKLVGRQALHTRR